MKNFMETSLMVKIGFLILLISFSVDLVGFGAPFWYLVTIGNSGISGGLWQACSIRDFGTFCTSLQGTDMAGWFIACQVLEVLGFLTLLGAVVVVVLYLFVLRGNTLLYIALMSCCYSAACLILLGVIIYGAYIPFPANLHFGFGLTICGAILATAAGTIFLLDYFKVVDF